MSSINQQQQQQQEQAQPGIDSSQQNQATTEFNNVGDTGQQTQKNMGLSAPSFVGGPSMMGLMQSPGLQVPFSVGSQDLSSGPGVNLSNIYAGGNKEKFNQLEQMIKTQMPLSTATLQVRVVPEEESNMTKNWQLTKEDLEKVFNPHGTIEKIEVGNLNDCSLVTFENLMQAFSARSYLNGKRLTKGMNATLQVQFVQQKKEGEALSDNKTQSEEEKNEQLKHMQQLHMQYIMFMQQQQQSQLQQQPNPQGFSQGGNFTTNQYLPQQFMPTNQTYQNHEQQLSQNQAYQNQGEQQQSYNDQQNQYEEQIDQGIKYTCSYEIQIENEKEFQVARRVIGSKGSNMKRIIEECAYGFDPNVSPYEIVKLRLRGKGSGFKEGRDQLESDDPLNLCISSKYKEKYDYACSEMETLLLQVYDQFREFYQFKQRKPANHDSILQIKKKETTTQAPKQGANEENQNGYNSYQQPQQQHHQNQYNPYYPPQQQQFNPNAFAPQTAQNQQLNGSAQPFIPSMVNNPNANGQFKNQQQ